MVDEDPSLNEIEDESSAPEEEEEQDAFTPFEEIANEFQPGNILKIKGEDGLPQQYTPDSGKSDIPALSPTTLICSGDYSEFRDTEGNKYTLSQVVRCSEGHWVVRGDSQEIEGRRIIVEPKRQPCSHYVRQMTQADMNPEIRFISRLCSARRDRQGAFMSVRDTAVYACDMRNPPDVESTKLLDDFDQKKIQEGKNRDFLPMFKGSE
jgi:hypothetical protein